MARQALAAQSELDARLRRHGVPRGQDRHGPLLRRAARCPRPRAWSPPSPPGSAEPLRDRRRRAGSRSERQPGRRSGQRPVASGHHARPRLHRCHRCAPRCPREGPARTTGLRGALPGRRPARRPDLGDLLRRSPARARRRGSAATSPSTGRRGRRPPTARGTSRRSWTSRPASTSRSCCASSAWPSRADPAEVLAALPLESPPIGAETLRRSGPTLEATYGDDLDEVEHAIEVSYEGCYELDEPTLADGSILDDHFSRWAAGSARPWCASATCTMDVPAAARDSTTRT